MSREKNKVLAGLGEGKRSGQGRATWLAALAVAGVVAMGLALYMNYRHYVRSPEPGLKAEQEIEIKAGANFSEVTRQLSAAKVISSPTWFKLLARQKDVTTDIQAGEYTFTPGMTPLEILNMLSQGAISGFRLVVPEGFTVFQIAKRLDGLKLWSGDKFLKLAQDPDRAQKLGSPIPTLEGYLFPATYPLKKSMTEETILSLMINRGREEKTPARIELALKLGLTWHQVLTLASLLQAETAFADEMPMIAGVFLKRIQLKMRLQCDPTAVYGRKDLDLGVTRADLKTDSPYNTYLHAGLPPGPISNPGADAILAALHPASTDYLYFVAGADGRHLFAKTYDEHRANVNRQPKKPAPP